MDVYILLNIILQQNMWNYKQNKNEKNIYNL
jgi:hypothetical protein